MLFFFQGKRVGKSESKTFLGQSPLDGGGLDPPKTEKTEARNGPYKSRSSPSIVFFIFAGGGGGLWALVHAFGRLWALVGALAGLVGAFAALVGAFAFCWMWAL